MLKKYIKITAALCLVFAITFIANVFADNEIYSGTYENLSWTLNSLTGELVISGEGEMKDTSFYDYPWNKYNYLTKHIIIEDGVTSVGYEAFKYSSYLKSLTIGRDVNTIGSYSFAYCYTAEKLIWNAKNVADCSPWAFCEFGKNSPEIEAVFSDNTETIPSSIFSGATNLTKVTFGSNIKNIGSDAFSECTNLNTRLNLDKLEIIGSGAFYSCGITEVNLPAIVSIDTGAFNDCDKLEKITLGQNLDYLGDQAFRNCVNLKTINWNVKNLQDMDDESQVFENAGNSADGIEFICGTDAERIPAYILYNCTNLKKAVLNSTLKEIGESAFYGCTALKEINLTDSITNIEEMAFCNCSSLTNIHIPSAMSVIQMSTFENCSSLKEINIPDNITEIDDYSFASCGNFKNITLGKNITSISGDAFADCEIEHLIWNAENTSSSSWKDISIKEITFGDSVVYVPCAFDYNTTLEAVTFGPNIAEFEDGAFEHCTNLKKILWNIKRPYDFENINQNVFYDIFQGAELIIGEDVERIPTYAFYSIPEITKVTFNEGVTSIGYRAFYGCTGISELEIPASLESIEEEAFYNCGGITSLTFKNGIKSIGAYAFRNCTNIPALHLPDSLAEIGDGAFYGCSSIKNLTLSKGLSDIPRYAFYGCSSIDNVMLPDNIKTVGDSAFSGCGSIEEIALGTGLTSLGNYSFNECAGVKKIIWNSKNAKTSGTYKSPFAGIGENTGEAEVIFGEGVEQIPEYAFYECTNITKAAFNNSLKEIGKSAFQNCGFKELVLPDSLTEIGSSNFLGCKNLESIKLPDNLEVIWDSAFAGNSSLKEIKIPDTVTRIRNNAFENSPMLKKIEFGKNLEYIGSFAFYNCTGIEQIIWNSKNLANINERAFETDNTERSVNVIFTDSVEVVPAKAASMVKIKDATLGKNIKYIEGGAFAGCNIQGALSLPNTISIGEGAFSSCTGITSVDDAHSLIKIGNSSFVSCTALQSFDFSSTVIIGSSAFKGCKSLKAVSLPKCRKIGSDAFANCTALTDVALSTNMGIWYSSSSPFSGTENIANVTIPTWVSDKKFSNANIQYLSAPDMTDMLGIYGRSIARPGEVFTLSINCVPSNAHVSYASWTSDSYAVANVENGVVECKGKGVATISATLDDKTVSMQLIVTETEINFLQSEYMAFPGDTVTVEAVMTSEDYNESHVTFGIDDSSVAEIVSSKAVPEDNGKYRLTAVVKALKEGETALWVNAGEMTKRVSVISDGDTKISILTPNDESKDFISCKLKDGKGSITVDASIQSNAITKNDISFNLDCVSDTAKIESISYTDKETESGINCIAHIQISGSNPGRARLFIETTDEVSASGDIMVRVPLKIVTQTPSKGDGNVSLWGGKILGYTANNDFAAKNTEIEFDKKIKLINDTAQVIEYDTDAVVYDSALCSVDTDGKTLLIDPNILYSTYSGGTTYSIIINEDLLEPEEDMYYFEGLESKDDWCFTTEKGIFYGHDDFSFKNISEHIFKSSEKKKNSFHDSTYKTRLMSNASNIFTGCMVLKDCYFDWQGSCFGMASVKGMIYNELISPTDISSSAVGKTHDLTKPYNDMVLRDNLFYYHLLQNSKYNIKKSRGYTGLLSPLFSYKKSLEDIVTRGRNISSMGPFIINFDYNGTNEDGKEERMAHAILAHRFRDSGDFYELEISDSFEVKPILLRITRDFSSASLVNTSKYGEKITGISYSEPNEIYHYGSNEAESPFLPDTDMAYIRYNAGGDFKISTNGLNISYADGNFSGNVEAIKFMDISGEGEAYYTIGIDADNVDIASFSGQSDISVGLKDCYFAVSGSGISTVNCSENTMNVNGNNMNYTAFISNHNNVLSISEDNAGTVSLTTEKKGVTVVSDNLSSVKTTLYSADGVTEQIYTDCGDKLVIKPNANYHITLTKTHVSTNANWGVLSVAGYDSSGKMTKYEILDGYDCALSGYENCHKIKAFLWDDFSFFTPLSVFAEISDE